MVSSLIDRGGYPTLRECVYLNQASLGLIADPAVEAMHDLLDRVVRHGNLHMSDEDEAAFLDGLRRARRPDVVGERRGRSRSCPARASCWARHPSCWRRRRGRR